MVWAATNSPELNRITVGDTPTRVTAADADEDGRVDLIVTNIRAMTRPA